MPGITLVAHADWSVSDKKRWMACARRDGDEVFLAITPAPVRDAGNLVWRLKAQAGDAGCALVGFDFPIGVPLAYARKADLRDFREVLLKWGEGRWADFGKVTRQPNEICLERPFYPQSPEGCRRANLSIGLGIEWQALYRECERAHAGRRAACPLFWTLGGQQVGKAAISGWDEVLAPAVRDASSPVAIWPFAGKLNDLVKPGNIVIAETYPGEFYNLLGLSGKRWSKRRQADRQAKASVIVEWARKQGIALAENLGEQIQDGFGSSLSGEDKFDAVIGLMGMLNTLYNGVDEPEAEEIRSIEGWILGQKWRA